MVDAVDDDVGTAVDSRGSIENERAASDIRRDVCLLLLLYAPLYLSDFLLIGATSRKEVLTIDYVSKAAPLLMLAFMPAFWPAARAAVATRPHWRWTAVFVPVSIVAIPALLVLEIKLARVLPNIQLFDFPSFRGRDWYWFDLTFGLTLNSISEELVCRGMTAAILSKYGRGGISIVVVSALVFAGAHWSKGLANIVVAGLYGILFMTMYLKTRSIWPGAVVHTAGNVVVFA